jgi:hypothetical protein
MRYQRFLAIPARLSSMRSGTRRCKWYEFRQRAARNKHGQQFNALSRPSVTAFKLRAIEVESLMLAVSVDHRLSVEPVVSMADLRNEPFVAYESRDGTPRQRSVSIHNRAATKVLVVESSAMPSTSTTSISSSASADITQGVLSTADDPT